MALPSSGQIGLKAIYTELTGIANPPGTVSLYSASTDAYATINPNSAAQPNTTAPYAMSSWYSYDQSAVGSYMFNFSQDPMGDPGSSCVNGPGTGSIQLYSNVSSITMSTVFYTDSGLTTIFNGDRFWYYSLDNNITYRINAAGAVIGGQPC